MPIPRCSATGTSSGDAAMTTRAATEVVSAAPAPAVPAAACSATAAATVVRAVPAPAPAATACSATVAATAVRAVPAPAPAVRSVARSPVSIPRCSANGASFGDAAMAALGTATTAAKAVVGAAPASAAPTAACSATSAIAAVPATGTAAPSPAASVALPVSTLQGSTAGAAPTGWSGMESILAMGLSMLNICDDKVCLESSL
ncbi:unnamed protein product, partial [Pylaiella littoralis]